MLKRGLVDSVQTPQKRWKALPPTEGLRWYLADGSRVIARPSGTEPKLKVYLEVVEPVTSDLAAARTVAAQRLAGIRTAMEELTRL